MSNFLIDDFTKKGTVLLSGILALLIIIGNSIEDEPIKREPWLPRNEYEKEVIRERTKSSKAPTYYYKKEPWNNDRKEQTENWADFLEELDNRGYTIYDPEAEDIWEEFY